MKKTDFFPLGTVVRLSGGFRPVMIIARAVAVKDNESSVYFDYGACHYPEGLLGAQALYFQHDDIVEVFHVGHECLENQRFTKALQEEVEKLDIPVGDARRMNKQRT